MTAYQNTARTRKSNLPIRREGESSQNILRVLGRVRSAGNLGPVRFGAMAMVASGSGSVTRRSAWHGPSRPRVPFGIELQHSLHLQFSGVDDHMQAIVKLVDDGFDVAERSSDPQ